MTSSIPPPPASGSGFKDPRIAATISYFGGMITGIIFLIAEKEDRYVRFHAMQSTVVFLGVFVLHLVLLGVPLIGWMLYMPFIVGVIGLWGFLMFKAFTGEAYKLPYIGEWAERQVK